MECGINIVKEIKAFHNNSHVLIKNIGKTEVTIYEIEIDDGYIQHTINTLFLKSGKQINIEIPRHLRRGIYII